MVRLFWDGELLASWAKFDRWGAKWKCRKSCV